MLKNRLSPRQCFEEVQNAFDLFDELTSGSRPQLSPASYPALYLGVSLGPVHPALAAHLSDVIGKGRGILVTGVADDSPAHKAGIRIHDILVSYDKQDLYSAEQLVKLVQNDNAGREVTIVYVHRGELKEATVQLESAPASNDIRSQTSFCLPFEELIPEKFSWLRNGAVGNPPFLDDRADASWKGFQSLTIRKLEGNRFEASIEYRDREGKDVSRQFTGTRQEIRKAIEQEAGLSGFARGHLLRSLGQETPFPPLRKAPVRTWEQESHDRESTEF